MSFIDIPMAGQPLSPNIQVETLHDRYSVRFCAKLNYLPSNFKRS
jgi:hypothetical protein